VVVLEWNDINTNQFKLRDNRKMNDNLTVTLLCSVLIAFSIAFAQTEISGEVSGEWNAEGSPYIVLDSTWVPAGEELHILEGVTVRFADQTGLYVHGVMSAIGSEEDSVHFTTIEEGGCDILDYGLQF